MPISSILLYDIIMKAEEFSKNILSLDPRIRFAGIIERSGHLYAGGMREGIEQYLKGKNSELSLYQSARIIDLREMFSSELGDLQYVVYNHDKVKIFSLPIKEYILVFSADNTVKMEDTVQKVLGYIKSIESELSLTPPSNLVNNEKKEALKNLYESGIEEEMIADQLDLDLNTVKMLIHEIRH